MRLNCGAGNYPLPGYVSLDWIPPCDLQAKVPPLPFQEASLEEIYTGHFLEHLNQQEGQVFVQECWRCLKPGGKLTLVTPDMRQIMTHWLRRDHTRVLLGSEWREVDDLDDVCQSFLYGEHQWAYDYESLSRLLTSTGFRNLREINRYRDPRVAAPAWFQVGVEGVKV